MFGDREEPGPAACPQAVSQIPLKAERHVAGIYFREDDWITATFSKLLAGAGAASVLADFGL